MIKNHMGSARAQPTHVHRPDRRYPAAPGDAVWPVLQSLVPPVRTGGRGDPWYTRAGRS